jgi:DNA-binding CsgD family transcriptional regulator
VGLGEIDAGLTSIDAALAIALELRIPDDIGRAYVNKVDIEGWSAYPERALETSREGMRVSAEWGVSGSYGAYVGFGGVNAAFELGRWDEARDLLATADRLLAVGIAFLYRASYAAELLACTGDEEFEPMWARASRLALEAPPSDHAALLFLGGIEHAAFAGEHARAVEYVRQAVSMLDAVDSGVRFVELARVAAWPLAELGAAARREGDRPALTAAAERLDSVHGLAAERVAQVGPDGPLAELLALELAEIECWRMRLEGRDTALDWQRLASAWSALGRPFRAALARWHEAEAAERAGGRDGAVAPLRAAHATAAELGAAPLLGQLEVMARRMRVRLESSATTATPSDRAYGLTRREQEVLMEVAAGRTNREIAQTLFISESTAGVHVSNILGKLGVSTRTEAARVALDQGLVGDG